MKEIKINQEDLIKFLNYLNDKVIDVYKEETSEAIKEFLNEVQLKNLKN